MRVLILGATGMLGKDFVTFFLNLPGFEVYALSRSNVHTLPYQNVNLVFVDATDKEGFAKSLRDIQPELIVHCAALTNIDACEEQRDYALWLHGDIIKLISREAPAAKFIYVSTDSVFDGTVGNYSEQDEPAPVNYYAATKRNGETNTLSLMKDSIVLRTNIYGYHLFRQPSLSEWALDKLSRGETFTGFVDVYFNPVYTGQVTEITWQLLQKNYSGIVNVASDLFISKYEFLKTLARTFGFEESLIHGRPFDAKMFSAPRACNTTLNTSNLQRLIGYVPALSTGMDAFFNEYQNQK